MKIEPIAAECLEKARAEYLKRGKAVPPETMGYIMALSQAESLKRIADAMWGTTDTQGLLQFLNPIDVRNHY